VVQLRLGAQFSPIGVDIGSSSIKLVQLDAECRSITSCVHWDLSPERTMRQSSSKDPEHELAEALQRALGMGRFRGRRVVVALGSPELLVQNIRVANDPNALDDLVCAEAASRIPFPWDEAEIRYLEIASIRQAEQLRREVILLACHRPVIDRLLKVLELARLACQAIDVEPIALLRCYSRQFRRESDQARRVLLVSIGYTATVAVIAQGTQAAFMKYIEIGGRHFDEAVAKYLAMPLHEAAALRQHHGDRRADQRDPEVARSLAEAIRPALDRLATELTMCLRYFSVTFRGQPVDRLILSGGEASAPLADWLGQRLDLPSELGDPMRVYERPNLPGPPSRWDIAVGLALNGH